MKLREGVLSFYGRHKRLAQVMMAIVATLIIPVLATPFPHYLRIHFDGGYAARALLGSDFYSAKAVTSSEKAMLALEDELLTRTFLTGFSMRRICELFGTYQRGAKDCQFAETLYTSHLDENRKFLALYIRAMNACHGVSQNEDVTFIEIYNKNNGYTDECDRIQRYLQDR